MAAVGYAVLFVGALLPGLPLGIVLFGRRPPAAWVAGGLFGYVLTALALWAGMRLGVGAPVALAGIWLAIAWTAWFLVRDLESPLVSLPDWSTTDTKALLAVLALTLAIAVPPFMRVGAADAAGNRLYRAYFTADFVWHAALASELAKGASPPRNPYLASRPIHYYWTYFLVPASVARTTSGAQPHVETFLKVNAVGTAVLFVAAIFICAWAALPRSWPVAAGVALAIVASSAEGSFALWRFWQRGVPLGEVRNLNIDALSNWWFYGLRVDGLQRCFWWVPQHSMAYGLGLVALTVVTATGSAGPLAAIVLAGVALGGATMMNPFVGGIFSLAWGLAIVIHAARSGTFVSRIIRHTIAALPVLLAVAWCVGNSMVEGGGAALQFGWHPDPRDAPVRTLLLSLGPVLLASLPGLVAAVGSDRQARERFPTAAAGLAAMSLILLYCVRLNVDSSWVGFRAGQMFLVAVPIFIARGLAATGRWQRLGLTAALVALVAGGPTTLIDLYNAQDVTNFSESPIGPWTLAITPEEQEAFEWLRRSTPATAIVQMEPMARERQTWSIIPSFAQRRMAAGRPISLLGGTSDHTEYAEKSARVRTLYATEDVQQARALAETLHIDYIWVDKVERAAYPSGTAKFDTAPRFFAPAFRNAEVAIYRVQ